jgi:hypothetical protein
VLTTSELQDVPRVVHLPFFHSDELKERMDSVILHLDGRAKVIVGLQNFSAVLFGMNPYLCHLFIQLDNHRAQPWWQWVPAVSHHIIDCI